MESKTFEFHDFDVVTADFPFGGPVPGATLPRSCRILIAEDHTILREGLRALLSGVPQLQVAGEAVDGMEAIRMANDLQPDLVLLDLSMPRTNGLEALREIKRTNPHIKVLILTVQKAEDYVHAALHSGADAYVLKDSSSADLFNAIRSVLGGERYLSPAVATALVNLYLGNRDHGPVRTAFDTLSSREREVLKLLAEGYRTRDIGDHLCISPKTVEKHRASLMEKLNLHTLPALTAYAIEKGLLSS
jgi:DNA-binding NarL/FixJ family response regulator